MHHTARNTTIYFFLIGLFIISIWSCADYGLKYSEGVENWETLEPPSNHEIVYSVFLIGDAGFAPENSSTPLFAHLKDRFDKASEQSSAVWLGDNLYPVGLAPEGHKDHPLGKHRITAQLKTLVNYPGKVFFIPGNHDWYEYGQEGLSRQEILIESFLTKKKIKQVQPASEYFIPDDGCGDVVAKKLSDGVVLIVIDSHWYLKSRYKSNTLKQHCQVVTHLDYLKALDSTFTQHKDDIIILASHHPLYTYGKHGGYYQAKYYFFPLTQVSNSLIIPMPFSGIIANLVRPYISEQDTKQALYGRYKTELLSRAKDHGKTIVVSGHEHNLQYIEKDGIPMIISGSGSKKTAVALGNGSKFAIGSYGYTRLDFYSDGQIFVHYISSEEDSHKEVFRTRIFHNK